MHFDYFFTDEHTTEHGSSSDDTVSSSFYGARRSVRYTSKRTAGTFRDYMRSRAMHVDDTLLLGDALNWENTSILSHDSQSSTSNEMNKDKLDVAEEDDGIFSPTQDDEFEDDAETTQNNNNKKLIVAAVNKHVKTAAPEFSEASPKQIYETSADDWYASASDQDDLTEGCNTKGYTLAAAVNPVLECVNQILLQQTMEEIPSETNEAAKTTVTVQSNLPRRSSLSGRRQGRSHSTSDSVRNKSLARKRVHFSNKNSMVHLPSHESDNEQEQQTIIPVNFNFSTTPAKSTMIKINDTTATSPPTGMPLIIQDSAERLETLNYESIYSNEYEPIGGGAGSEQNSSNLYVEMETERLNKSMQKSKKNSNNDVIKICKTPPELPPKPANLMKFKKSLQLTEISGDNNSGILEPEYCSISEVNVGMTSVQIVADVHHAPESVVSNIDLEEEVATVDSDEMCAASQKTEEIEEIFADIPKLPNVAAIIVPKQQAKQQLQQQQHTPQKQKQAHIILNEYLSMTPKSPKFQTVQKLLINSNEPTHKLVITNGSNTTLEAEKNIFHSNNVTKINGTNNNIIMETVTNAVTLPLQEEFDWYNLDAEYCKAKVSMNEHHKVQNGLLEEINEDHENERECLTPIADEYKLDEEFCLATDIAEELEKNNKNNQCIGDNLHKELNAVLRENLKTKKLHKNLDNFEKFIEGSGLSTKPLPHKRKIYFAGPFV